MRRSPCSFLGLLVAALVPTAGSAHPQFTPTDQNRYLKISLTGGGTVRVAYTVMVGEVPALRARKLADASGDGTVDEGEQRSLAEKLGQAVERGLLVEVDGVRRPIRWDPPSVGLSSDRQVGPIPFSVDLVGRVQVGSGEHRVRLDDTTVLDALGETEIRLEEGPGTTLLGGWQGREDGGKQVRFLFRGPKFSMLEDRSIGFRFVDHSRAGRRKLPIALVGSALSALMGVAMVRRLRRRMDQDGRFRGGRRDR